MSEHDPFSKKAKRVLHPAVVAAMEIQDPELRHKRLSELALAANEKRAQKKDMALAKNDLANELALERALREGAPRDIVDENGDVVFNDASMEGPDI